MHPSRRRFILLPVALAVLAGCGTPPWQKAVPAASTAVATPSATPTHTPTATVDKVHNDLAKGVLRRSLTAGGVGLAVTYYSTLNMGDWTPAATKPLTVALVGDFTDGSKQNIYLSDTTLAIDVNGPDGPLPTLKPLTDKATVKPGYLIKAPTSYGQVFTIPALPSAAESVTINFTYELLVQTAPKVKEYARQSASDTVVIALAPA